jgi:type II pantothenate kinase
MSPQSEIAAIGIDLGASRIKVARHGGEKAEEFRCFPTGARSEVAEWARSQTGIPIGLTGAGATSFAEQEGIAGPVVDEFNAWAMGSRQLLRRAQSPVREPYLLVSLGTGTSVLRVEPHAVTRVGGSSLGGGTLMGLAALICDCRDFDTLRELAARGDRRHVDLVLADLYPPEQSPLPGHTTASSFARVAATETAAKADVSHRAAGLMGLLGENIGLLASALARAENVLDVVFGGSVLRDNPTLTGLLQGVLAVHGQRAHLLPEGEYAGAMGALMTALPR